MKTAARQPRGNDGRTRELFRVDHDLKHRSRDPSVAARTLVRSGERRDYRESS